MTDVDGSFTRNPEVVNAPMLRPNNSGLANIMVQMPQINSNAQIRPSSQAVLRLLNPQDVGSGGMQNNMREPNDNIPDISGGKLKYPAGWDPQHPRLSRDPTWYPGRGKARAVQVFGDVAKTIEGAGKIAAAVG